MGKHEYRGVRAQRAMNLAAARKADREKLNRLKYGYPAEPVNPEFYPRNLTRPITPRPSSAGLAMRRADARDAGLVVGPSSEEKPKENIRSTSWKYLHTCIGVMAAVMVGIGLLVGITSHWTTSRAGQAGIGLICGGVGIVITVVIFAYVRLKHAKLQEKRREAKHAKADLEAGKKDGTAGVQFKRATTAQDVPMRPITAKKKRKKRKPVEEKDMGDTDSCTSKDSISTDEATSDTAEIVPRSSSRTSMNLQGSINMSAIPEDEEEDDHGANEGPSSSPRPTTTTNEDELDKDSLPGVLVTSETTA